MPAPGRAPRSPAAAVCSRAGRRPYQQDRYVTDRAELPPGGSPAVIAAVFDGHGTPEFGHEVSEQMACTFVNEVVRETRADKYAGADVRDFMAPALRAVVATMERQALELSRRMKIYHGSTLCAAVVLQSLGRLVTANVGDSRAVLASGSLLEPGGLNARQLTVDHSPTHPVERERIEAAGGWVSKHNMLNGYIGMSRAIGDNDLKEHRNLTTFQNRPPKCAAPFAPTLLLATPDVETHELQSDDHFLLIASDGVWHMLDSQSAVAVVGKALVTGKKPAEALYKTALDLGAGDNITVIIVPLSEGACALMESPNRRGDRGSRRQKLRGRFGRGVEAGVAHTAENGAVRADRVEPRPSSHPRGGRSGLGVLPSRLASGPPSTADPAGLVSGEGGGDSTSNPAVVRADSSIFAAVSFHSPAASSPAAVQRAASFSAVDLRGIALLPPGVAPTARSASNAHLSSEGESRSNRTTPVDTSAQLPTASSAAPARRPAQSPQTRPIDTSNPLRAVTSAPLAHLSAQNSPTRVRRKRWKSRLGLKFGGDRGEMDRGVVPGSGSLASPNAVDDESVHGAHVFGFNSWAGGGEGSRHPDT